jgi:hypothetical protein
MNTQPIQQNIQATSNNIEQSYNSMRTSLDNNLNSFSQKINENAEASTGFLSSNTIVAKFAFIILIIIIFVLLLNLGIVLLSRINSPSSNPYLINGMISGGTQRTITQDPSDRNAIPISRSNNEKTGLEFTYSTWIYLEDIGQNAGNTLLYRNIFNKGDNTYDDTTGIALNNGPGLYLESPDTTSSPEYAQLKVIMDTYADNSSEIEIDNVPIKKWVNVIIRAQNTVIDVYINGSIAQRVILDEVPKQNYYNMHVGQNGGFSGQISNLRYYQKALNIFEIKQILDEGPNLNSDVSTTGYYNYLSNLWYSANF